MTRHTSNGRSISINGALYELLKQRVGQREKGSRGRISRTVDKLINDYLDQQEQNRGN